MEDRRLQLRMALRELRPMTRNPDVTIRIGARMRIRGILNQPEKLNGRGN